MTIYCCFNPAIVQSHSLVPHEDVQSIKLEIEIMTRLSGHPDIVDLKAVYEKEDYVHLVMEHCIGGSFRCVVVDRWCSGGGLDRLWWINGAVVME
ncbi:calcium,calmodulin-dependent protein kinase [Sarracenia purpurea var. burkii]